MNTNRLSILYVKKDNFIKMFKVYDKIQEKCYIVAGFNTEEMKQLTIGEYVILHTCKDYGNVTLKHR